MNFPDTPLTRLLYAFINTPSIGGIIVGLLALFIIVAIFFTLRWIARGSEKEEEAEVYAFPTTALHHQE